MDSLIVLNDLKSVKICYVKMIRLAVGRSARAQQAKKVEIGWNSSNRLITLQYE